MSKFKATLNIADHSIARTAAMGLEELIVPAAHATSLFEHGTGWLVEAYYDDAPDADVLNRQLRDIAGDSVPAPTVSEVPPENWVRISQAALPPVTAGRFTVHGSHDRDRIPRGPNAILVDAGEAFGTAHHATTQGCLIAIDRLSRRGRVRRSLDLGCGSGVLAIALARCFRNAAVIASDIDPIAVEVAATNAALNGVGRRVRPVVAGGMSDPRLAGRYDVVVANILAAPLIALAGDVARAVRPGGMLILSGLLVPQAAAVSAAYVAHGFRLSTNQRIAGWSTLTLVRDGKLKPSADRSRRAE